MTGKKGYFGLFLTAGLILFFSFPQQLCADERNDSYSPIFFGLSTEFTVLPGIGDLLLTNMNMESVCLTAAIGHRDLFVYPKLRARGGLGFWPGSVFVAKLGLELPLVEFLNSMRARLTGLYSYSDIMLRIKPEGVNFAAETALRLLIPLSAVGGVAIGAGFDTDYGLVFHIDYLAGFYSIQ
jgi:hypothetical protein